jgi:hypothetical protein
MPKVCARPLLFRDVPHMLGDLHSSTAQPRPYLAAYGVIGMSESPWLARVGF